MRSLFPRLYPRVLCKVRPVLDVFFQTRRLRRSARAFAPGDASRIMMPGRHTLTADRGFVSHPNEQNQHRFVLGFSQISRMSRAAFLNPPGPVCMQVVQKQTAWFIPRLSANLSQGRSFDDRILRLPHFQLVYRIRGIVRADQYGCAAYESLPVSPSIQAAMRGVIKIKLRKIAKNFGILTFLRFHAEDNRKNNYRCLTRAVRERISAHIKKLVRSPAC